MSAYTFSFVYTPFPLTHQHKGRGGLGVEPLARILKVHGSSPGDGVFCLLQIFFRFFLDVAGILEPRTAISMQNQASKCSWKL